MSPVGWVPPGLVPSVSPRLNRMLVIVAGVLAVLFAGAVIWGFVELSEVSRLHGQVTALNTQQDDLQRGQKDLKAKFDQLNFAKLYGDLISINEKVEQDYRNWYDDPSGSAQEQADKNTYLSDKRTCVASTYTYLHQAEQFPSNWFVSAGIQKVPDLTDSKFDCSYVNA